MTTANNLYSPDEIEVMKASGSVASKTLTTGNVDGKVTQKGVTVIDADAARPANSEWSTPAPRIGNSAPKVSQPNIRAADGSAVTTKRVTTPNTSKHLAEHEERLRKEAARQAELLAEQEELFNVIDPRKLHDSLQVLDRKVRKLERENRELKKKVEGGQA